MKEAFENELHLAEAIQAMGGRLYLVGGAVRDQIKGIDAHDRDYMVTGLSFDDFKGHPAFRKIAGAHFPVFLVDFAEDDTVFCNVELALARKERSTGYGHVDFDTITGPDVTLEDDLVRRDFTINAMAKDVLTGEFFDPHGGMDDIEMGVIRHVSEAFSEDPLRVFRAARFAARFEYDVAQETIAMMRSMRDSVRLLPGQRVFDELVKALATRQPSDFFQVLDRAEILDVWFPELAALHVPDRHDGTAFEHTMTVMDSGRSIIERWGLLVHDFGKGLTDPSKHPQHHGHDKLGIEPAKALAKRLFAPSRYTELAELAAKDHMRIKRILEMRPAKLVRFVATYGTELRRVINISMVDSFAREGGGHEDLIHFHAIKARVRMVHKAIREITGVSLIDAGVTLTGRKFGEALMSARIGRFKQLEKKIRQGG